MKVKIGRDKASAKVYLAWLKYIRNWMNAGNPTTITDEYRFGKPLTIEAVKEEITKLEKEIAS